MTIVPRRYVFLLIPGYSQLGFACALEALSLANLHPSGQTYYTWMVLSADGTPVPAYNGITTVVDGPLTDLHHDDTLVVCAGEQAGAGSTKPVLNWLRRETRRGIDFGALSSGAYTLALAGLLAGKRVVTHWQYRDALCELLPDVTIEKGLFTIDGRVFTTAGGAASMDMMPRRDRRSGPPVHPPTGTAVRQIPRCVPQAALPQLAAGEGTRVVAANLHERDRHLRGLRFPVPVAFLKVLPQQLWPEPRTGNARHPFVVDFVKPR